MWVETWGEVDYLSDELLRDPRGLGDKTPNRQEFWEFMNPTYSNGPWFPERPFSKSLYFSPEGVLKRTSLRKFSHLKIFCLLWFFVSHLNILERSLIKDHSVDVTGRGGTDQWEGQSGATEDRPEEGGPKEYG